MITFYFQNYMGSGGQEGKEDEYSILGYLLFKFLQDTFHNVYFPQISIYSSPNYPQIISMGL